MNQNWTLCLNRSKLLDNAFKDGLSTRVSYPYKKPMVVNALSSVHDNYVVVPAYKDFNIIVSICKQHYLECLTKKLRINSNTGNPTYSFIIIHKGINFTQIFPSFFGINITENDENNFPSILDTKTSQNL